MVLVNSDVPLFIFYSYDLSIGESGALKLPSTVELQLFCSLGELLVKGISYARVWCVYV